VKVHREEVNPPEHQVEDKELDFAFNFALSRRSLLRQPLNTERKKVGKL
jgi:hypothetical protein